MKYIFMVNSFTLKEDLNVMIHDIKEYCEKEGIDYEIEVNSESISTEDILKKYKRSKNIILSIGGDGTLNRIVNNVARTKNIVGVIPFGTGNDFYRSMTKQFSNGINDCDLIKINDNYFINTACFGIDAKIANVKDEITSKWIPRSQRYNASILKCFVNYKPIYCNVSVNGEEIEDYFATIVVCNGEYYGSGFNIGPTTKLNDGLFDVYLVKHLDRFNLAKLILKMKNGHHEGDKNIIKFTTDKVVLKFDEEIIANIDGDQLSSDKFIISLLDEKLEIYYDEKLVKHLKK